jgi:general secretion pathway protein L
MTLFIALPSPARGASAAPASTTAPPVYRYAVSLDGASLAGQGEAPLSALPRKVGEVAVVVPADALSWHRVKLPQLPRSTNAARLRTVLEGLVEERVLDEPAMLHLALAPGVHTGPGSAGAAAEAVWVACCYRPWLEEQLLRLEQHGIRCGRILPAAWPLPAGAVEDAAGDAAQNSTADDGRRDDWLLTGDAQRPWLQVCSAVGVWRVPLRSAADLRRALAARSAPRAGGTGDEHEHEQEEPGAAPLERLEAEPEVVELGERWLQRLLPVRPPEQGWLRAAASGWNLAQFDLRQSGHGRLRRRAHRAVRRFVHAPEWRRARIGLVLLTLAHLAGLNGWAWQQRHEMQARREAVRQLLVDSFPGTRTVVDAPVQMAREVAALRQAGGQLSRSDLEALLHALASTLPAGQRLQRIDYQRGEFVAAGLRLESADLAAAQQRLAGHGLRLAASPSSSPGEPERFVLNAIPAP